jgi:hypothetical protein
MCPEITFGDKSFCLTGESRKATRAEIARRIESIGGKVIGSIREDLDYLIVCAAGNSCWAFSCYGRKVETAVNYRKKGARIVIAHENDLWDAIADKRAQPEGATYRDPAAGSRTQTLAVGIVERQ